MDYFKKRSVSKAVTLVVASMASTGLWAETRGIDGGGFRILPGVTLSTGHDDNIFESSTNQQSSSLAKLKPFVELNAQTGLNEYSVYAEAEHNSYFDASEADHTNFLTQANIHQEINSQNRITAEASIARLHNMGAAEFAPFEPEQYTERQANVVYGLGRMDGRVQVDLFGDIAKRDYKEHGNQIKDSGSQTLGATVYYRVAPKTRALVEYRRHELGYNEKQMINGSLQDSAFTVDSYLAGLTWDATDKTRGYAKLGRGTRQSEVDGVKDARSTSWEVGVSYQASARTLIQLATSQSFGLASDDPGQTSFADGINTMLSATYQWTDRINTRVSWTVRDEDIQNAEGKSLKQRDTSIVDLGLNWDLGHSTTLSFGYGYRKRDESLKAAGIAANEKDEGYSRNVYTIGVSVAI